MNAIVVVVLFALMQALRSFGDESVSGGVGVALAFGYLLLSGYFVGRIFANLKLPRLTGYIVTGIVTGPAVLNLVDRSAVHGLEILSGMAISLIALTAGTELDLRSMRPLLKSIRWITITGVLGTAMLLSGAVFVASPWLEFMTSMNLHEVIAVSVVMGVVMVAQSPAVVVALKNELKADGPVSRTVLGIVVLADLVVILLFAMASTVAKAILGTSADLLGTIGALAWEIIGSLSIGAVLGAVLALYMKKAKTGETLFLLTVVFIIAEVGKRLHLDPLLVSLGAGILIRNATKFGEDVHKHIEASSLPVYIVFFALAGATLHLHQLMVVGLPALVFVLTRGFGLIYGTRLGAKISGAQDSVVRYAGYGLLPQAGLAIALAMMFSKTFPEFGSEAGTLVLSVVAINELVAPALFRNALFQCGEVGQHSVDPSFIEGETGET
ncbi:MAG: cation:proton antiporter [Myxococcota bacterium]|jgi:Kef-type K+ transport system membrane component KefB|nr:cation:proton antiporter [Myxococcota bacterium]